MQSSAAVRSYPAVLQVYGLSLGMFLGTVVNSIIYAWMCGRTDWQRVRVGPVAPRTMHCTALLCVRSLEYSHHRRIARLHCASTLAHARTCASAHTHTHTHTHTHPPWPAGGAGCQAAVRKGRRGGASAGRAGRERPRAAVKLAGTALVFTHQQGLVSCCCVLSL